MVCHYISKFLEKRAKVYKKKLILPKLPTLKVGVNEVLKDRLNAIYIECVATLLHFCPLNGTDFKLNLYLLGFNMRRK